MTAGRVGWYFFWLAIGVAGVALLWRDVQTVPPYPDVPGVPNQRVAIGFVMAGLAVVFVLVAWAQRFRRFEIPGRPKPEPFTAADFLLEVPFVVVGVVSAGLSGALSPYYGIIAVVALALSIGFVQSDRMSGPKARRWSRVFAGAQVLFIGAMFFIAHREIGGQMGQTPGGEAGAVLALVAPGARIMLAGVVGR